MTANKIIQNITEIDSIEDDPWFQSAETKNPVETQAEEGSRAIVAPKSLTETLFWLSTPSITVRIVVAADYAKEFTELIKAQGVSKTLHETRRKK